MVKGAFPLAKMYATVCEEGPEDTKTSLKGKGVPTKALEKQYKTVEAYKDAILKLNAAPAQFRSIQSKDHIPQHKIIVKSALTADNDKVFLVGSKASRPLGHYKNRLGQDVDGWAEHRLPEENLLEKYDQKLKEMQCEAVESDLPVLVDKIRDDPTVEEDGSEFEDQSSEIDMEACNAEYLLEEDGEDDASEMEEMPFGSSSEEESREEDPVVSDEDEQSFALTAELEATSWPDEEGAAEDDASISDEYFE